MADWEPTHLRFGMPWGQSRCVLGLKAGVVIGRCSIGVEDFRRRWFSVLMRFCMTMGWIVEVE